MGAILDVSLQRITAFAVRELRRSGSGRNLSGTIGEAVRFCREATDPKGDPLPAGEIV